MAREKYKVVNGPGIADLMFAVFDCKERALGFEIDRGDPNDHRKNIHYFKIISIRKIKSNKQWEIRCSFCYPLTDPDVFVMQYRSDTRKGTMVSDKTAITTTSVDDRKECALMIVIEKIVAQYQNFQSEHGYKQDEEFFKLLEKAKGVHFATDAKSLTEAIKQI